MIIKLAREKETRKFLLKICYIWQYFAKFHELDSWRDFHLLHAIPNMFNIIKLSNGNNWKTMCDAKRTTNWFFVMTNRLPTMTHDVVQWKLVTTFKWNHVTLFSITLLIYEFKNKFAIELCSDIMCNQSLSPCRPPKLEFAREKRI